MASQFIHMGGYRGKAVLFNSSSFKFLIRSFGFNEIHTTYLIWNGPNQGILAFLRGLVLFLASQTSFLPQPHFKLWEAFLFHIKLGITLWKLYLEKCTDWKISTPALHKGEIPILSLLRIELQNYFFYFNSFSRLEIICEVQYGDDEVLCWCQFDEFQKSYWILVPTNNKDLVDQHSRHSCLGSKSQVLVRLYETLF